MSINKHEQFMRTAIDLARQGVERGDGGPFGAIVVRGDVIIGRGWNRVVAEHDPTAHAEVNAIRDACRHVGDFRLDGCVLYTSCEPCPMCLAAAYWARLEQICYAADEQDAASIGFDDRQIRQLMQQTPGEGRLSLKQLLRDEALEVFRLWRESSQRVDY